jgi:hypothetical protein
VIEMSDEKTKIECRLVTRGTEGAEAQANDDLSVPDPEQAIGKQIIDKEDEEDGDQPISP